MSNNKNIKYDTLCAISSHYLNTNVPSVVAVAWLHIVRDHSTLLRPYDFLFNNLFCKISSLTKSFFLVILSLLVDLFDSLLFGTSPSKHFNRKYFFSSVFVSHALSFDILSATDDFYFGSLPCELNNKNLSVCTVYLNHTKQKSFRSRFYIVDSHSYKILLPSCFDIYTELSFVFSLFSNIIYFITIFYRSPSSFTFWFSLRCIIESFSRSTRLALRLSYFLSLISNCNTNQVITTYEGHSWERLVYHTLHKRFPSIVCCGYLHAILFNKQFSATLKLNDSFNPDHIFTAGPYSNRNLCSLDFPPTTSVSTLGSSRSFNYSLKASSFTTTSNTILVLPEGLIDECLLLFNYSLQVASIFPQFNFIWRVHPVINFYSQVASHLYSQLPPNIYLSTSSLESDILKSKFCLYRGSTAAVTAASHGCIPIFLDIDGNLNVDPLYEVSNSRPSVSIPSHFLHALAQASWTTSNADYCKNIYTPINVDHFLSVTAGSI